VCCLPGGCQHHPRRCAGPEDQCRRQGTRKLLSECSAGRGGRILTAPRISSMRRGGKGLPRLVLAGWRGCRRGLSWVPQEGLVSQSALDIAALRNLKYAHYVAHAHTRAHFSSVLFWFAFAALSSAGPIGLCLPTATMTRLSPTRPMPTLLCSTGRGMAPSFVAARILLNFLHHLCVQCGEAAAGPGGRGARHRPCQEQQRRPAHRPCSYSHWHTHGRGHWPAGRHMDRRQVCLFPRNWTDAEHERGRGYSPKAGHHALVGCAWGQTKAAPARRCWEATRMPRATSSLQPSEQARLCCARVAESNTLWPLIAVWL
jgi:hypothetical protein